MKNFTGIIIALFLIAFNFSTVGQNVVINEIMSSNSSSIQDEDGSRQDWIELYNKGTVPINLLGFGLSDDAAIPYKWTFPNVTITPGQYIIIWASDKNRAIAGSPLHTNFKITSSGENIILTNTAGVNIDTAPPANLQPDVSYGRLPNGTGPFVFFGNPTPEAVNSTTGYSGALSPPSFSQSSGFFTAGFSLTISSVDSGTTILYTLDGSEPDQNNLGGTTYSYKNKYPELPGQSTGPLLNQNYQTLQYNAPISIVDRTSQPNKISLISSTYSFDPNFYFPDNPVFKGNVIRAKVIKAGYLPSKIVTKNYFVSPQGSNRFTLPVVSLSLNEDRFLDYQDGIYVAGVDFDIWRANNPTLPPSRVNGNYVREGIANEKVANMSYYVNGNEVINQEVGLRIRGASTRRYECKSLTVFARSEYGKGALDYKFFTDLPYTSFERLTLSNSGSDFRNTMFRDALGHQLCKTHHNEIEAYQPTIAFVNGEYWGIINIRERYDNNYFERVYNTAAVDFLENNATPKEGDAVHYNAMKSYINANLLATTANFDYIKTQLDPESFSDYYITNIFFQNSDWPNNNVEYWRNKIPAYNPTAAYGLDGRWRWMLHDMDDTFSFGTDDFNGNTLAIATSVNNSGVNPDWSTFLLRKLLDNDTFKVDFINRFADLLNTSFLPSRIISKMDEMKAVIAPEMPEKITRWSSPANMSNWRYYLDYQKDFANARPAFQRNHIRAKFGISSNINATLNVSGATHGYIKMNTINIIDGTPGIIGNPYPWTGIYFKNIPVKLKAIAKPGFVFSNWSGESNSTNPEITITPTGNFSITAVFIPVAFAENSVPIYFWMMNGNIVNGAQLTSLNSTYQLATAGAIQYQSSISGYPLTVGSPNFGKGSMERRNNPTAINYRPAVNGNLPFASSDMKGLQIKQPFQNGGLENTMFFNFSTSGYKKVKFSFAAVDEGAATAISIDYSINSGAPVWITTGITSTSLTLMPTYQLFETDFSAISTVNNNPDFKIRLRFTGPNMTSDTGARVSFNNIAVDAVKIPLTYPTPNIYIVGNPIVNLVPTVTETITNYSVAPALPTGLSLNPSTGVISGTPTSTSAEATYVITATNSGGSTTFGIVITVNSDAPSGLSYSSPNVYTVGNLITALNPAVSGTVSNYSISPLLPAGLSLNSSSGTISGTPTIESAESSYTVTATNSGGSTAFAIVITVNNAAPSALSYPSPNVFTVGNLISALNPSVSATVSNYSISPSLPDGLFLDSSTGTISGTPTTESAESIYTVTATNSGGSTNFAIYITVNSAAPSSLNYPSPNIFTVENLIVDLNPTVSGTVSNYGISPSLPDGLFLNLSTGIISGTPIAESAEATYTVTATNSGGSTTFAIVITVNSAAPSSLSYPSPNIFTVGNLITELNPTVFGTVSNFGISPSLPDGLFLNSSTGIIYGTPIAESAEATYVITATNSGGNTTFGIVITVNSNAPSGLSYPSPNIFTIGNLITELNPAVSGTVSNYTISPSLPDGLLLNSSTGIISGTPIAESAEAAYAVTATNSGGTTTFGIVITVNNAAPSALSYPSPNVFTVGNFISALNPTVSGTVSNYTISPSLPDGLLINSSTGIISGTPIAESAEAAYAVTATNSGGNTTFGIVLTVNNAAPNALSYPSPNIFTVGNLITELNPTVSGTVSNYTISPSLPDGLFLDPFTGIISGTPSIASVEANYTVDASNFGGSTTFEIVITVNDAAPDSLSYMSPNIYTVGIGISNLNPMVSGSVSNYSVTPALPDGLSLDALTGVISGTPTISASATTYTVTASNSGGSTTFEIVITINNAAPVGLSYFSPNIFTVGINISTLHPTVIGDASNYSVSPALPNGLSLNPLTGIISGVPIDIASLATYTITASNSGGSTTFGIVITVNDSAPIGLNYPTPNVFSLASSIPNLFPSYAGNVISFIISPDLPSGLVINSITGVISGTPLDATDTIVYTITAINTGGSVSFEITITIDRPLQIEEDNNSTIKIYPNPFYDVIKFLEIKNKTTYKVFTIEGKLIKQGEIVNSQLELNHLPKGLYLLNLYFDGNIETRKIIKR